jgi:hypothetical protein
VTVPQVTPPSDLLVLEPRAPTDGTPLPTPRCPRVRVGRSRGAPRGRPASSGRTPLWCSMDVRPASTIPLIRIMSLVHDRISDPY